MAADESDTTQTPASDDDEGKFPLPCPHCGCLPKAIRNIGGWFLDCQNDECPARGVSTTKANAITRWNRRVQP